PDDWRGREPLTCASLGWGGGEAGLSSFSMRLEQRMVLFMTVRVCVVMAVAFCCFCFRLQKMGCSCSTSSDEWSDSDSDSSLSELPPFVTRSTKTVELRQHTSAGTQHACLDEEVKGDSSGTCEEPLESHPRVALPRLSTGGEENTLDGSKPSKPVQCATDEPGPSTVLKNSLLPPPPEPETGLLPPPPEPETSLLPPPLEPDTGLLPPPPEPETGLLPPSPEPETVFLPPPPEPDTGLLPPPPEPEAGLLPPPPPETETSLLPPPLEPDTGLLPPLPEPETGLLPPPPELSLLSEVNVRLTTGSSPHIVQQTHRGFTKSEIDWQDNAVLQRPWLPVNSRVKKIPSREEGDGPSVSICFYKTLEDLGTPRPECQDVGTQTLPPGAGGDAPTPSSKIDSVCPERRVMAEGGNSGDKPKATLWSQGTPQAGFPQRGGGDTPGPVLELQPSKAQNSGPMLNRGLEQSSKTKADHQPAHPPGQQVGSKLTYAQVLMMPPRKRAPPPDLSPPYPEQEPQSAGTRRPLKLRYARL
ncbi:hypothetical protein D4764_04G0012350, partial [Takifugu flavidus]